MSAAAACSAVDQRGVARPKGAACDSGAYELAPQLPSVADTYGRLALAAGELPKAREALETAYRAGGLVDPEIRFHYAAAIAQPRCAAL